MRIAPGASALGLALIGVCALRGSFGCGESGSGSRVPPRPSAAVGAVAPVVSGAPAASSSSPARAAREPVVVAIVVDQLSAWVAASRLPELPADGGFARLLREGTWVKNLRFAHAETDTAPGHAALHTGKVPAEHGIFGNEVPDATGRRVSVLRDAKTRLVAADGPHDAAGSSAARLRADTVADRLRAARPDALVVSVSVKDRGAILPAGKSPTWALWFDAGVDQFVTSTAFGPAFPRWALAIGDARAVAAARAAPWVATDAAWLASHAASPDDAPGEGDLDGLGIRFPHVVRTAAAFRASPASDAMILALAKAAVDAEVDPARPTLLLLSMSASDIAGHVFGPDSWEAWDQLRKLDAALGAFLDALEKKVGPVSVLLAADHGNVSMPEADVARRAIPACRPRVQGAPAPAPDPYGRPCTGGGERLGPNALRDELAAATVKALAGGPWIAGLADPYVLLTRDARALPDEKRKVLDAVIRQTLGKHKGVAEVFDTRTLGETCPAVLASSKGIPARAAGEEPVRVLVCRSWPRDAGAGDYYVVPRPGSFFDGEVVVGKGTSHGTPYLYDRTVSMIVRAPGEADAAAVIEDPVDFTAFAALEAHLVGLDPRPVKEILEAARARP